MPEALRIYQNGPPSVLVVDTVETPRPAPGEVLLRHSAIAVNYSDINVRRGGFYVSDPLEFPVTLGNEAAGVVEATGDGVEGVNVGDRVGYVGVGGPFYENTGAYADLRAVPADCLIPLPDDITDEQAAAAMLKGFTAASVIRPIYTPGADDWVLIHAAASGVGSLLAQWCHHLGATVIGTVGSRDKADYAKRHGCHHTILYREEDFVETVNSIRPEGVSAVFDGVGKDTFIKSMDCVRPYARLVNYGNASGHVPPIDLMDLSLKGSLSVSRPGIHHYVPDRQSRLAAANDLFDLIRRGVLAIDIQQRYALTDARRAHEDVEARRVTGSVVLIPS